MTVASSDAPRTKLKATASRSIKSATPGQPAGNIENSLCTRAILRSHPCDKYPRPGGDALTLSGNPAQHGGCYRTSNGVDGPAMAHMVRRGLRYVPKPNQSFWVLMPEGGNP